MRQPRFVKVTRSPSSTGPATARHPAANSTKPTFDSARNACSNSVKSPGRLFVLYVCAYKGGSVPIASRSRFEAVCCNRKSSSLEFVPPRSPQRTQRTLASMLAERVMRGRSGAMVFWCDPLRRWFAPAFLVAFAPVGFFAFSTRAPPQRFRNAAPTTSTASRKLLCVLRPALQRFLWRCFCRPSGVRH